MAQQDDWVDLPLEQQATTPSKGIPRWLLFCGCGCLLALLAVGGATAFGVLYVKRLIDPEHQLPRLARIVPFDEPLEDLEFKLHIPFGVDAFILQDTATDGGYALMFNHISDPEKARRSRERAFDPTHLELIGGAGRREQVEPAIVVVQGRPLECVRFLIPGGEEVQQFPGDFGSAALDPRGAAVLIDVTPPGTVGVVLLSIYREEGGDEPISDDYIRYILAPFHVGPDR